MIKYRRRRIRSRMSSFKDPLISYKPLINLWVYCILVDLKGYQNLLDNENILDRRLADQLELIDPDDPLEPDVAYCLKNLQTRRDQAIVAAESYEISACLEHNLSMLSALLGLTETDRRILTFTVLIHASELLDAAADCLGALSTRQVVNTLSILLDLDRHQVEKALSIQGALIRSGLINIDSHHKQDLRSSLHLISSGFADVMLSDTATPADLLRGKVKLAETAILARDDYAHVEPMLKILLPYLEHALQTQRKGVNICIYGKPGTGKSQLVRMLAQLLKRDLFEVSNEDEDGDPISGSKRLQAYSAGQKLFSQRDTLIVFDEAEDVMMDSEDWLGRRSTIQSRKGWFNQVLETNAIPTFWLSNRIQGMDNAFIRRFDVIFELPIPPKSQLEKIIRQQCGDLINQDTIAAVAELDHLAPAVVTRVSQVISSSTGDLPQPERSAAFKLLINNTLAAQGHHTMSFHHNRPSATAYDLALIHADYDLNRLTQHLAAYRVARICLYGPPGTGKTAYAHWLAKQLDLPLHIKRGSDLLSKWVGENEKNIAEAFQQAEREGALLLIDEVDSFLTDRRHVEAGWQTSQINEMLIQMENYNGIFMASTNLMDNLDPAVLRRFDLKIKFAYLQPDQTENMLIRCCEQLKLGAPNEAQIGALRQLNNLTVGDFATISRQHRFYPIESVAAFIMALKSESAIKEDAPVNSIGFIH